MAIAFGVTDEARLDARAFRAVLLSALGRTGEGVVVCGDGFDVLYVCPRGLRLLERLGGIRPLALPQALVALVTDLHDAGECSLARRISGPCGAAIHVRATVIRGAPPARVALWLREEARRDEHLYADLHERYGLSRRAFQLSQLVRQGLSNRAIARELRLTEATVKVYLHHLYRACGVRSRTALIALISRIKYPE